MYKWENREHKLNSRKNKIKKSGANISELYKNSVDKKIKRKT